MVFLDEILEQEAPNFVLVQGDTTSALAGSIAAFGNGPTKAWPAAGRASKNGRGGAATMDPGRSAC